MLGGVCAGIGIATRTPAWVWRLFFLASLFFGGYGLLLYIVLWILLPYHSFSQAEVDATPALVSDFVRIRKGAWVAGVCTGLAAKTGYPVWLFRLLFVLGTLISLGGLLIYIILWIVSKEVKDVEIRSLPRNE